jgi:dUTP pyrophosphatase
MWILELQTQQYGAMAQEETNMNYDVLKFAKTSPDAVLPKRAKAGDAGYDLTATSMTEEGSIITYGTGIIVEIPPMHVGLIFPRSSIYRYDLILANSVGVIDSGYRGEIMVKMRKTKEFDAHVYEVGERMAQLVVIKLPDLIAMEIPVEEVGITMRGTGGFGSTGTANMYVGGCL